MQSCSNGWQARKKLPSKTVTRFLQFGRLIQTLISAFRTEGPGYIICLESSFGIVKSNMDGTVALSTIGVKMTGCGILCGSIASDASDMKDKTMLKVISCSNGSERVLQGANVIAEFPSDQVEVSLSEREQHLLFAGHNWQHLRRLGDKVAITTWISVSSSYWADYKI